MAGGYFTDVVLHSSKNYHQESATVVVPNSEYLPAF
jgi:hypothetical protein